MESNPVKAFKYDVAISLCKQDVDFAGKLVKALNPHLSVFFYENRQEELIGKSGPEAFARVFKTESRLVIILSRDEWSKSFYTELERNAILDRITTGYDFLMVMPMVEGQVPAWYPSTRIYTSPLRFTIEELARFIEFKVTDQGGVVKPLTVEERYEHLLKQIENKKQLIRLQTSKEAIEQGGQELTNLMECFNSKAKFLQQNTIYQIRYEPLGDYLGEGHIAMGGHMLQVWLELPDDAPVRFVTTQDFKVTMELSKIYGKWEDRKVLDWQDWYFYYTPNLFGWAKPFVVEQPTRAEMPVLFKDRTLTNHYDLTEVTKTAALVDHWFQELLNYATQPTKRYT